MGPLWLMAGNPSGGRDPRRYQTEPFFVQTSITIIGSEKSSREALALALASPFTHKGQGSRKAGTITHPGRHHATWQIARLSLIIPGRGILQDPRLIILPCLFLRRGTQPKGQEAERPLTSLRGDGCLLEEVQ